MKLPNDQTKAIRLQLAAALPAHLLADIGLEPRSLRKTPDTCPATPLPPAMLRLVAVAPQTIIFLFGKF